MTVFSLTTGRLFDVLSNNEYVVVGWLSRLMTRLGNNTEADDMLSSIGTSFISFINDL